MENVGNLVCPAEFDIGEHVKMLILTATDGSDKPYKYPLAFEKADVHTPQQMRPAALRGLRRGILHARRAGAQQNRAALQGLRQDRAGLRGSGKMDRRKAKPKMTRSVRRRQGLHKGHGAGRGHAPYDRAAGPRIRHRRQRQKHRLERGDRRLRATRTALNAFIERGAHAQARNGGDRGHCYYGIISPKPAIHPVKAPR